MNTPCPESFPRVTLIIRSIDRPTLSASLDSVAIQTYPHIEVIVVNAKGGNHTDLGPSCGRFPLRLINQAGNQLGRSAAANAGLDAANGDLLGFLDDDDLLFPEHVANLVTALSSHPNAIAAYSRVRAENLDGHLLHEFATPFDTLSLYLNNFLPIHAVLFRSRVRAAEVRFDETLDLCEDWDFWIQVAQYGEFTFVDQITAIYRIGGGSGFALTGDPEHAKAAERSVCAKWQSRMDATIFYNVVRRARAWPKLQELQANNDYLEFQVKDLKRLLNEAQQAHAASNNDHLAFQVKDLKRLLSEAQQAHAASIELYENSSSWRLTRPLRRTATVARQAKRALHGFYLLDWRWRLQVIGWLLTGQLAPARRKLSLSAQSAEASLKMPLLPIAATPSMYHEPPKFSPLPMNVDIVVPIFNGFEFLESLFDGLERAASTPFRLLICDDASTDERVWPWLEQRLQDLPETVLLRNTSNLGFVGTVNRLFEYVQHDFVLLNSDVQVPPFWLERLFAPILANPQTASVTPFTNAGTICSFPHFFVDNPLPIRMTAVAVDKVFARLKDVETIEISTGVGFCMAIRLEIAKRIGLFDPAFGKGYGEENDWCQRASKLGYHHVLAPNLFIHHKHGGSFSSQERQALANRNKTILRERHPGLFEYYEDFIRRDPIRPLRDFMHLMVLAQQADRRPLVVIDNVIEGGAYAYSHELIDNTLTAGIPVLHLLDDFRTGELRAEWLSPDERFTLNFSDYSAWGRVLAGIQPESVLINNLYSFRRPMDFLHWLANEPTFMNEAPLRIALHDFFMLCPSLFLIDRERNFCGLPDITTCNRCFNQLHMDFPIGAQSISEWRMAWAKALAVVDDIIVFSNSTRDLFARIYPEYVEKIIVQPHSMKQFHHHPIAVDLDKPLHIGIVGSIAWHKGWNIVKQLCEEIDSRLLPFRVTVIGTLIPNFSAACLNVTGRYERAMLPSLIEKSGANIFLFPSICPETFSYVAHELIACEVPLCCFNLGAPAEAAANYCYGLVLDQAPPDALLAQMESFRKQLSMQVKGKST